MDRDEYVEWCKARARKYLNQGELVLAVNSMISDMDSREDTKVSEWLVEFALLALRKHDYKDVQRFIEGFN